MIKPTKYPMNPDDLSDLFGEAVTQGKQGKQDTLVSGTNIKTINGDSILGSGDLTVSSAASWGSITGTLSSQSDLNTALNAKASTGAVTGTGITMSTARILGRSTAGTGAIEEITVGTGLTLSAGTLTASGGSSSLTIGTTAITSGTVGRILFEGTGNVLQQSANLFWDNTNSRLGIGTASPSYTLQVAGTIKATGGTQAGAIFGAGVELTLGSDAYIQCTSTTGKNAGLTIHRFSTSEYASLDFLNGGSFATGWSIQSRPSSTRLDIVDRNPTDNIRMCFHNGGNIGIGTTTNAGYRLDVNGTARVQGNLDVTGANILTTRYLNINSVGQGARIEYTYSGGTLVQLGRMQGTTGTNRQFDIISKTPDYGVTSQQILTLFPSASIKYSNAAAVSTTVATETASACFEVESTTKGFLPPRMTTAQKNAIATPAAGLVVYDTTLNKLCVRTASAWETITSL